MTTGDVPDDARPMTVAEVAKLFDVGTHAVVRWINSGKLRATKPGRRFYVSVAAVRELLAGGGK